MKWKSKLILVVVATALVMRLASTTTANLSYVLLACLALLGRAHAIQALALSWLFTMMNPMLCADATSAYIGRYAVLSGAALSMLGIRRVIIGPAVKLVMLMSVFGILHSLAVSPILDVSLLKLVSWGVTLVSVILSWSALDPAERVHLENQVFGGLIVLMLVSLLFLPSSIGFMVNGTGFQGVLNHPQAFGLTMALLGAWSSGQWVSHKPSHMSLYLGLTLLCMGLIVLSEARVAAVSMLVAAPAACLTVSLLSGRSSTDCMPNGRPVHIAVLSIVLVALALAFGEKVMNTYSVFMAKGGRSNASSIMEAYEQSRGAVASHMWENIEHDPYVGLGFGMASDPRSLEVERESFFGLPTSAPIEKGILPLAVWEELGLLGLGLLGVWVALLLRSGAVAGVTPLAVAYVTMLLNLGESTFFSPGGMGLLPHILFGWILSAKKQRQVSHDE